MAILIEYERGKQTVVANSENIDKLLTSQKLKDDISAIRKMLALADQAEKTDAKKAKEYRTKAARKKASLPGFIFQAREMEEHVWIDSKKVNHGLGHWRHQDWAHVNGLVMCDFDHIDDPKEIWESKIRPFIITFNIYFAYITPSGHGLKVVFRAMEERGDIAANQKAFATAVGIECDEVCFDASRLSFATSRDDVLYMNLDALLNNENEEFIKKFDGQYFRGVHQGDCFGAVPNTGRTSVDVRDAAASENPSESPVSEVAQARIEQQPVDFSSYKFCGISIPDIIEKLLPKNGVPEGKRHATLFDVAKKLRYVCERSTQKVTFFMMQLQWVKDLDSEDHNVQKTIDDAMGKPYSSYMPKDLKQALVDLGYEEESRPANDIYEPYVKWGERLQGLMDKFPCLREISYNLEVGMIPSALFVCAAFFGTLMTRTWWYHWFDPLIRRRLNYSIIVIGDPGSGKSFAGRLYKLIMEPIIVADKVGNKAINDYKKQMQLRDSSDKEKKKDALPPPENIIRIHGARTANGVFIEDMNRAVEMVNGEELHLHLFTFSAELDQITSANKGGQWIDKTNMELLAFHNEEDNQQYKNRDSYNGPFDVYWNFVYTGTPVALNKKVNERNFGTGLFGRLGCVPIASDYFTCAPERKKTKEESQRDETLKKWAYILDKAQGELPLEPVVHSTFEFTNEVMTLAEIEGNKADAFLVRRVPYYGVNISAPFIFMRHYKEWEEKRTFKCDKYDIELCKIAMEVQMHSQRHFFGRFAEMYFDDSQREKTERRMRNYSQKTNSLFDTLPKTFKLEDIMKAGDISQNAARIVVSRWRKDSLIKKLPSKRGNESWQKNS